MVKQQAEECRQFELQHQERWQTETRQSQDRFNKGLRGLLDRVMGKYRQLREQNELEALQAGRRDREVKDKLRFQHLEQRRSLQTRTGRLQAFKESCEQALSHDRQQYQAIMDKKRAVAELAKAMHSSRSRGVPVRER